jgi:hypothetical protein
LAASSWPQLCTTVAHGLMRAAGRGGRVTLCGFIELATLHPLLCRSSGVGSLDQSNGNHSHRWKVTDGAAAHVCDFVIFDL